MATRRTILRSAKSIAGTAILMLGMFILYQNVAGGAARVSHALTNGSQAFGVVPTVVLAASQPARAYAADHHRFLQSLFHQALSSFWPLLLVIFGSVLSRETFRDQSKRTEENNQHLAEFPPPCPTYNFAKSRRGGNPGPNLREF
jgi:hypothetical protein